MTRPQPNDRVRLCPEYHAESARQGFTHRADRDDYAVIRVLWREVYVIENRRTGKARHMHATWLEAAA